MDSLNMVGKDTDGGRSIQRLGGGAPQGPGPVAVGRFVEPPPALGDLRGSLWRIAGVRDKGNGQRVGTIGFSLSLYNIIKY